MLFSSAKNYIGEGYWFKPSYTSGWNMKQTLEKQLESESTKPKPDKQVFLKQLIKKNKRWKLWKNPFLFFKHSS